MVELLTSTLIIKLLLSQKWMCTQTNKYNYNITVHLLYFTLSFRSKQIFLLITSQDGKT